MKTALVTGASNGIGLEIAKIHASKGGNLVLVARSIDKLELLKTEFENQYNISVEILQKDLGKINAPQEIYDEIKTKNIKIDYLINNAGIGTFGNFHQLEWKQEEQMINLNITALAHLCHLFLKDFVNQKSGKILNVASTAAFQPGPTMAVYFATKAFVLHFSEAIHEEVKNLGITVTALCPGATQSGFFDAAKMHDSNLVKGKKLPTSKEVAEYGYNAMLKGKSVVIHGTLNYILANSVRFAPRNVIAKISKYFVKNN